MTRACCPNCRLRFPRSGATSLAACPFCGGPLESRAAQGALGMRLVGRARRPEEANLGALAAAISALAADDPGPR